MRISDWSADLCSSDLQLLALLSEISGKFGPQRLARPRKPHRHAYRRRHVEGMDDQSRPSEDGRSGPGRTVAGGAGRGISLEQLRHRRGRPGFLDRKSVVSGTRVSVRVDLGGRRIIKKKKKKKT